MSSAGQQLESSAFNFSEYIQSGVDVRTGSYSTRLKLAGWTANEGNGPHLPLQVSFDSFRATDLGWGRGWSLSLSSFDQKTHRLTLASGVSYRLFIENGQVIVKDKKLENTRVTLDGDKLVVSHLDGTIEVLSRPDDTYDEWLPEHVYSNEGRSISLGYGLVRGRRLLKEIRDQQHRAVLLDYESEDQSASIILWPDIAQRRLGFSFRVRDGWLRQIDLDDGSDTEMSWSFDYQLLNGLLVMTDVRSPGGSFERIEYEPQGHRLPLDAPVKSIPAVRRRVLAPGAGRPPITHAYEYSAANFLGFQSGLRWTQDGDVLASHGGPYTYTCTERLMNTQGSEGVEESRTQRTYNRFHLMIEEKHIAGRKAQQTNVTYHDVDGLAFADQPANFQMQKTSAVTYSDSAANTPPRTETTHTSYDVFGNLLVKINPSGAREDYLYYPAEGAQGCPANALGFISALKERAVTPSPDFAPAQTVRVRFTYIDLPSLRRGGHRFLLPQSEKLFEGDQTQARLDTRFEYHDDTGHEFFARVKQRSLVGQSEARALESAYSIEGDYVKTLETLVVSGHRHVREVWHDRLTGLECRARDAGGNELIRQYDRISRVIRQTVASNQSSQGSRTTAYLADGEQGLRIDVTSVRGVSSKTWVDGLGRTLKVELQDVDAPSQPMRRVHEAEYDHAGRVTSEVSHDWSGEQSTPSATSYHYDGWGRVCKTVAPEGVITHDVFDPVSMTRTRWIDGAGKTRTTMNVFGKPDREERLQTQGSDEVSRVVATFSYDGLGRCVRQTNEAGAETRFRYDVFGRVIETVLADGTSIKKKYSPLSTGEHPIEIKANDYLLGTRTYDGLFRVTQETVGGRSQTKRYEGGYLQACEQVTAAGDRFTFTLDPLLNGAVTAREGAHAQSARFRFDPLTAQIVEATSPVIQRRVEYAPSGQMKSETWRSSDSRFSNVTDRSLKGLPTRFTDVNNVTTTYTYDAAARPVLIQQGSVVAKYTYDPQGQVLTLALEDTASQRSVKTTLTHDPFGREIRRISEFGSGARLEILQTFGADDKLQQRSLTCGAATRSETFAYDLRGRLTRYDCQGTNAPTDAWGKRIAFQVFTYDYLDNLSTVQTGFEGGENLCTFSYDRPDKTQMSALTHSHPDYQPRNVTFEYDTNGNLLNDDQGRTFKYDALSRLEYVMGLGDGSHYQFDAEDQLHAVASDAGSLLRFFYNERALCSEVEGGQRRSLLENGGMVLAERQGDEVVLFMTDGQGTSLGRVGSADEPFLSHTPFGDRPASSGLGSLPGFQGERLDPSTGCYLLGRGYRPYNPRLMRFCSPDSWSPFEGGGINAYAYCLGDPVNLKDPTGHISAWGWVKIGVTAALTVASVALTIVTLGGAAPLVPISASSFAWLAIEAVSGAISISSSIVDELAPDTLGAEILTYSSLAFGLFALNASVVAKFSNKGIGYAVKKSVESLESVAMAQRGAARVAVGRRQYGALSTANAALRNTTKLQRRLDHLLTAKPITSAVSVISKSAFVVAYSEKYAAKADQFLEDNIPSLSQEFSLQDLRQDVIDGLEGFAQEIGDRISSLRAE